MTGFTSKRAMADSRDSSVDTEDYFSYLDDLRDSGVTNMFGAAPYLQEEFGLDRNEARDILRQWMDSFH